MLRVYIRPNIWTFTVSLRGIDGPTRLLASRSLWGDDISGVKLGLQGLEGSREGRNVMGVEGLLGLKGGVGFGKGIMLSF
jgi:hypothetical protein